MRSKTEIQRRVWDYLAVHRLSVRELARRIGVSSSTLGRMLEDRPTYRGDADSWRRLANYRELGLDEGEPLAPLWWLLLTTGMRIGEALALRWEAVDLGRATLSVRVAKTPHGRRLIPLAAPTVARLGALWRALADPMSNGTSDATSDATSGGTSHAMPNRMSYVFLRSDGVPWAAKFLRERRWYPLLARLGLPRVHLHDLRHSVATLLLEMGVPLKVVAEILGHASSNLTADVYSHVSENMSRGAIDALGALLAGEPLATARPDRRRSSQWRES